MDVALEAQHVGRTSHVLFTSNFVGYVVGEEDFDSRIQESLHSRLPGLVAIGLHSGQRLVSTAL